LPISGVAVLQRRQRRTLHDRDVVARKLVLRQKLANLQLDQLQKLLVVHHVALFRNTTSAGTPTWRARRMCSRVCGIGPSAARNHQDRAVHLRRARDHVLHVVRVARAIDVRVVAVRRLVLHVRRR
jgi:hypothetical protein